MTEQELRKGIEDILKQPIQIDLVGNRKFKEFKNPRPASALTHKKWR